MKKFLLTPILFFACIVISAQVKYTEEIQAEQPGQGKIVLHQSKAITDLVNAVVSKISSVAVKTEKNSAISTLKPPQVVDSLLADSLKLQSSGVRVGIVFKFIWVAILVGVRQKLRL